MKITEITDDDVQAVAEHISTILQTLNVRMLQSRGKLTPEVVESQQAVETFIRLAMTNPGVAIEIARVFRA